MAVAEQVVALQCLAVLEDGRPDSLRFTRPPTPGATDGLVHCAVCDVTLPQEAVSHHLQGGAPWWVSAHRRRRHETGAVDDVPGVDTPPGDLRFPETEAAGLERWLLNWRMHDPACPVVVLEGCDRVYCQVCRAVFAYVGPYTLMRHAASPGHKHALAAYPPSVDWMGEIRWPAQPADAADDPDTDAKIERNLRKRITAAAARKLPAWQLFGAPLPALRRHIEARWAPGMTWANYGSWHIDHITPVQAYDVANAVHCLALCHWTNLQPLWGHDNLAKGAALDVSPPPPCGGASPAG